MTFIEMFPELNENQRKALKRLIREMVIEPEEPINVMVKMEHAHQEKLLDDMFKEDIL